MEYIKGYEKFFEMASPADLDETILSISAYLSDFYSIVSIPAYDADMEGEVITVKALRGDDYFVSFEKEGDDKLKIVVTTKDNTATLWDMVQLADFSKKPEPEAVMLYLDINERFGTLAGFMQEITKQIGLINIENRSLK